MEDIAKMGPLTIIIALQVAQMVWSMVFKNSAKDLRDNTHAIIQLKVQMEVLIDKVKTIPELEKDVNQLGSAMRELRAHIYNGNKK